MKVGRVTFDRKNKSPAIERHRPDQSPSFAADFASVLAVRRQSRTEQVQRIEQEYNRENRINTGFVRLAGFKQ